MRCPWQLRETEKLRGAVWLIVGARRLRERRDRAVRVGLRWLRRNGDRRGRFGEPSPRMRSLRGLHVECVARRVDGSNVL